jgi:hypothetical protein
VGATAASYANHKNVTHHANKAAPTQSFRLAVKPATEAPEQRCGRVGHAAGNAARKTRASKKRGHLRLLRRKTQPPRPCS